MINSCRKCNLRWFEGVVCRKMNCQKEHTALIWAVIRSHNCGLPMKHIIPNWTCRTLCWRVTGQITKFLVDPFERHRGAAGPVCFARGGGVGSGRGWRRSVARSLARSCRPHAGAGRWRRSRENLVAGPELVDTFLLQLFIVLLHSSCQFQNYVLSLTCLYELEIFCFFPPFFCPSSPLYFFLQLSFPSFLSCSFPSFFSPSFFLLFSFFFLLPPLPSYLGIR